MSTSNKKIHNLKSLNNLAIKLVDEVNLGDILLFKGEMGSGKTTFIRFFIEAFFKKNLINVPKSIKSPSFPIMINYPLKNFEVFHYDFYRINNFSELTELNIIENLEGNITLIEWPELFIKNFVLKNYFIIDLKIFGSKQRKVTVTYIKK